MIHECDRLPEELLDICKNTFNTHLGIEGHTGKGLDHDFRKTTRIIKTFLLILNRSLGSQGIPGDPTDRCELQVRFS